MADRKHPEVGGEIDDEWAYAQVDRVRFADLDARGHLNNVALLQFFEAARIAYLRRLFPEMDPTEPGPRDVILASQKIDYRAPAALEQDLRTSIRPAEVKRSSFRLEFQVTHELDGTLVADGSGVYVGFDYEQASARPLDEELAERLRQDSA